MKVKNLKIGDYAIVNSYGPAFSIGVIVEIEEETSRIPWCKDNYENSHSISVKLLNRIKPRKTQKTYINLLTSEKINVVMVCKRIGYVVYNTGDHPNYLSMTTNMLNSCFREHVDQVACELSGVVELSVNEVTILPIDGIKVDCLTEFEINLKDKSISIKHDTPSSPKNDQDQGSHYRKFLKVALTDADIESGFVEVQIDPFFLAPALGITDPAAFTTFKKSIRWGGSDAKDLKTDLKDIISACQRKLEIIELEDG